MRSKHTIIRDTREKKGWQFDPCPFFDGVEDAAMRTGDYTVKGLESLLTIERKRNTNEYQLNLFHDCERIHKEFERMRQFKYAYVIFEFNLLDVFNYPFNSGLPAYQQKYVKVRGPVFLKKMIEMQLAYPYIQFIYAGCKGKEMAISIMKRVIEREEECSKMLTQTIED